MILIIVYTPWGQFVFGTAPFAPEFWLFMMPCAIGMLLLVEERKWLVVRWNH
ncbi:cation transporting ATPase C-terminal domain-containing protein [Methylicorpusculum oleiharenae]|uniref:cation transporting ATPase C-terminal domain-containing protein n=1 Tax=Methylicorpusculum oleiharenae TaxID=1338687 RepID=UPI001E5FA83B|nr:cation transporting ATPase C-terminal domain-containing protein [Methylicorpusculum oleiharenae]MCD2452270.1 cation transporting ATPase C-terminal domain-containing protein [Methylicorpusculum oleiharenae]